MNGFVLRGAGFGPWIAEVALLDADGLISDQTYVVEGDGTEVPTAMSTDIMIGVAPVLSFSEDQITDGPFPTDPRLVGLTPDEANSIVRDAVTLADLLGDLPVN